MNLFPSLFFLKPHQAARAVANAYTAPNTVPAIVVDLLNWAPSTGGVLVAVGLDEGGSCIRESDVVGEERIRLEVLIEVLIEVLKVAVAAMLCDVLDASSETMNKSPLFIYNVFEKSSESL